MSIQLTDKINDLIGWVVRAFEDPVIEDVLNNARKSGEALCKAVIIQHYGAVKGTRLILGQEKLNGNPIRHSNLDYLGLMNIVVQEQERNYIIIKSKAQRHKIKSYLESIRTHGNPGSHDANFPHESSSLADARYIQYNLNLLVTWFYRTFLQQPIPANLHSYLDEAASNYIEPEEAALYEDVRGLDIVKICHPKQKTSVQADINDSSKKISYEFITTDVTSNNKVGYLFVKKNISISTTLQHFVDNLNCSLTSLIICSPRVISLVTGKEINRINSIKDKFAELAPKSIAKDIEYYFIDDFVWRYCLNEQTRVLETDLTSEQYFIDQELFLLQDGQQIGLQFSLQYIKQLIDSPEKTDPVSIILGRAGVGKTTFCEEVVKMVNRFDRKKALFISSTDLKDVQTDFSVNSVTDLYRLFVKETEIDLNEVLEPNSFEINISCGNIVLIIDGLDEIESILKDKFDLNLFLESAIHLNQAYKNCSILITSRDYYLDKYLQKDSINIFQLLGFNKELVSQYLEKRLITAQKVKEAEKYLNDFDITEQERHTPLYLSLICDLIDREEYSDTDLPDIAESRFFYSQSKLDPLVYKLLQREIGKQSLDISCDDYYELIIEISVKNQGVITKAALNEYVGILFPSVETTSNIESSKYTQFYNSPLWSYNSENDSFKIKYDFVELWSKVRFILHNFAIENLNDDLIRFLMELHDGTSILREEIIKIKKITRINYIEHGNHLLKKLTNLHRTTEKGNKLKRIQKAISGLLYLILSDDSVKTKNDYSETLIKLFGSESIYYLCIYGDFFPLDFTKIKVYEGLFEQYRNFDKCKLPDDTTVFYYSTFKGINSQFSATYNSALFDSTCNLNEELKSAFTSGLISAGAIFKQVQENLKKILKRGYRSGRFCFKSERMYKEIVISGHSSTQEYIRFLTLDGVLDKSSETGSSTGYSYMVANGYKDSAKNLIANNVLKPELEVVIKKILKEFYNL